MTATIVHLPPVLGAVGHDEHGGVLGHHDAMGVAVFVYLVPVQEDVLVTESTPVPGDPLHALPVVTEPRAVGVDGETMGSP